MLALTANCDGPKVTTLVSNSPEEMLWEVEAEKTGLGHGESELEAVEPPWTLKAAWDTLRFSSKSVVGDSEGDSALAGICDGRFSLRERTSNAGGGIWWKMGKGCGWLSSECVSDVANSPGMKDVGMLKMESASSQLLGPSRKCCERGRANLSFESDSQG